MSCRGVLFAIDDSLVKKLRDFEDEEDRLEWLQEELEEDFFENHREWAQETDKAWDAIHRALTDGELEFGRKDYPLSHAILGGELLYSNFDDYILVLKNPREVIDVAAAIKDVTQEEFKERYWFITNSDWEPSDEDLEYSWSWFEPLVDFYRRSAADNRSVVFSVDL